MSEISSSDPGTIDLRIEARSHDIGGFSVGRVLPATQRRMVGPFIFFDHMGPGTFAPGQGMDVRPHPHINLATVTYLFDGQIDHRDSLGIHQTIRPQAINLMVAGRGIVHSERSGPEFRQHGGTVHGIQLWLALPEEHEQIAPSFEHHAAETLPELEHQGVLVRVLMGEAWGLRSAVTSFSPLLYADAQMPTGSRLVIPDDYEERALYVVAGSILCGSELVSDRHMVILRRGGSPVVSARANSRVVVLGGAPLGSKRYLFWNFVSSSPERIEQAKRDWKEGRFPFVPGDENEKIPLPE